MPDSLSFNGVLPPPGLPDVATLARLATELFTALPGSPATGGNPLPSNPHPAGLSLPPGVTGPSNPTTVPFGALPPGANVLPSSPQSVGNAVASAPSLVPHAQAPNGVPDNALAAAPGYDGRFGSHVLGVPEALAASLPVPGAGFYFLNERPSLPATPGTPSVPGIPAIPSIQSAPSVPAALAAKPGSFYFVDAEPAHDGLAGNVPQAAPSGHSHTRRHPRICHSPLRNMSVLHISARFTAGDRSAWHRHMRLRAARDGQGKKIPLHPP